MTDKQIIIDGVDVSALYSDEIACMNRYDVARLFIKTIELLIAKEQECEELKKIINEAKNSKLDLKSFLVGEAVQNEYEQQLDQLKQTITEIKEICNNNDKLQGDFNLVDCDKYKLGKHNLANKILQKISEVE